MGNQYLGLSLFIMLLSFFLVLNSMSTYEESRTRPVLNSLSITFSALEPEENRAPQMEGELEETMLQGDMLDRLDTLFRSRISGADISKNRLGTTMHIRLAVSDFEKALNIVQMQDDEDEDFPFAQTLVSVMDSQKDVPYRLDAVVNTAENPAAIDPAENSKAVRRMEDYAEALESAGLSSHLITVGLGKGEVGMMDLYFYPYEPDSVGQIKNPG